MKRSQHLVIFNFVSKSHKTLQLFMLPPAHTWKTDVQPHFVESKRLLGLGYIEPYSDMTIYTVWSEIVDFVLSFVFVLTHFRH